MRSFLRTPLLFLPFFITLVIIVGVANSQPPPNSYGTYTTLSGFYDLQSTGNPCQYIRYNRRSGMLHAIFQVAFDSLNPETSRRTAYAYSSGGFTWNNCNNIMLGNRRTVSPSLDLVQTPTSGYPVIINEDSAGATYTNLFVDTPEGTCNISGSQAPGLTNGVSSAEV